MPEVFASFGRFGKAINQERTMWNRALLRRAAQATLRRGNAKDDK